MRVFFVQAHTLSFYVIQNYKSHGFKSGEREDHIPCLLLPPKEVSKRDTELFAMWAVAEKGKGSLIIVQAFKKWCQGMCYIVV
jgi:hypothetical protein